MCIEFRVFSVLCSMPQAFFLEKADFRKNLAFFELWSMPQAFFFSGKKQISIKYRFFLAVEHAAGVFFSEKGPPSQNLS